MKQIQWILGLIFLNLFCIVHAQSPEEPTLVKTRLVHLGTKAPIHDVGLWKDGKFQELRIPSSHFPEPVEYVGPNPITLVRMGKDEAGEKQPIPVAQAYIPEESEEVLLLMVPMAPQKTSVEKPEKGEEHAGPAALRYAVKVIDFSPSVFPDGSFFLWNLTGRPLVGVVGEVSFQAEPNQQLILQPDINGKPKALDAKIMYADDASRKSYTSRKWFLQPHQKFMMVMTANPEKPDGYLLKTIRY